MQEDPQEVTIAPGRALYALDSGLNAMIVSDGASADKVGEVPFGQLVRLSGEEYLLPDDEYAEWAYLVKAAVMQSVIPGVVDVRVTCSVLARSPYRWVEVLLSDRSLEGPYVGISPQAEYEDRPGYLIGAYFDCDKQNGDCEDAGTVVDMLAAVRLAVRGLGVKA